VSGQYGRRDETCPVSTGGRGGGLLQRLERPGALCPVRAAESVAVQRPRAQNFVRSSSRPPPNPCCPGTLTPRRRRAPRPQASAAPRAVSWLAATAERRTPAASGLASADARLPKAGPPSPSTFPSLPSSVLRPPCPSARWRALRSSRWRALGCAPRTIRWSGSLPLPYCFPYRSYSSLNRPARLRREPASLRQGASCERLSAPRARASQRADAPPPAPYAQFPPVRSSLGAQAFGMRGGAAAPGAACHGQRSPHGARGATDPASAIGWLGELDFHVSDSAAPAPPGEDEGGGGDADAAEGAASPDLIRALQASCPRARTPRRACPDGRWGTPGETRSEAGPEKPVLRRARRNPF
jgi:hypothetical protein